MSQLNPAAEARTMGTLPAASIAANEATLATAPAATEAVLSTATTEGSGEATQGLFKCMCGATFMSPRGLRIHQGRKCMQFEHPPKPPKIPATGVKVSPYISLQYLLPLMDPSGVQMRQLR
jgi:hypothetical protein